MDENHTEHKKFGYASNGGGEGSAFETLSGTGSVNTSHIYSNIGDYTITLNSINNCVLGLGYDSSRYCVMGSTGNNGQVYCNMLQKVEIGSSVTSISNGVFNDCSSLSSITIPDSVTSIASSAFSSCYGMAEYHFQSTTPPTLAGTNAFTNIPSDCKIYVPLASLTAYQAATNWATYASYMVGE